MKNHAAQGVSVILCCFNSATRIEKTLKALSVQQCMTLKLWEIILVDNASTDNTGPIADAIWKSFHCTVPLKIILEPTAGLGNARKKGIEAADYPYVIFCDDDNWFDEHYLEGIFNILSSNDKIAACGGMGIPLFAAAEPSWFYEYAEAFAVGSQEYANENGRILLLYGAGMGVQKKILDNLYESGFQPLFGGRKGTSLSSSEDTELTSVFVLLGYTLVYTDELKFYHYLPEGRLSLQYLKKLYKAFGTDGPVLNLYHAYITKRTVHRAMKIWLVHLLISVYRLVKYFILPPKRFGRFIYLGWNLNYIKQLLSIRSGYGKYKTIISGYQMGVNQGTPRVENTGEKNLKYASKQRS